MAPGRLFDMPDDARCRQFADYVVDNFVAADSDFPPTPWEHAPDLMPVTIPNWMELNPIKGILNAEFNSPHPTFTYLSRFCCVNKLQHTLLSVHCKSRVQFQDRYVKNPLDYIYANFLQIIFRVSRLDYLQRVGRWLSIRTVIVVCHLPGAWWDSR